MKCGVCSRTWPDDRGHVLTLTESERSTIQQMTGQPAPLEYHYCNPCWKLLSDRQQGAQFIAGTVRASLAAQGMKNPEKAGKKMLDFLLARSGKPVS